MVAALKMPMRMVPAAHDQDDRRIFPRKEVHLSAAGVRMDNSIDARQFPYMMLHLRDVSVGGLSAISPAPIKAGERLCVKAPRQGIQGGWDATGRVVRCEPSTLGFRIALEFDRMLAA